MRWKQIGVFALAAFFLFGCQKMEPDRGYDNADKTAAKQEAGGYGEEESERWEDDDRGDYDAEPMELATSAPAAERPGRALGKATDGVTRDTSTTAPDTVKKPEPARMIVYHAWLSIAVHTVEETLAEAETLVKAAGGYIESSTKVSRVLRVPSDKYPETLKALQGLGEVRNLRQSSRDVTEAYTNLVARIENLQALEQRYKELLAKATTMKDRLAIERELRRISRELQELQERQRVMRNLADFATIEFDVQRIDEQIVARDRPAQPFDWVHSYGLTTVLE